MGTDKCLDESGCDACRLFALGSVRFCARPFMCERSEDKCTLGDMEEAASP